MDQQQQQNNTQETEAFAGSGNGSPLTRTPVPLCAVKPPLPRRPQLPRPWARPPKAGTLSPVPDCLGADPLAHLSGPVPFLCQNGHGTTGRDRSAAGQTDDGNPVPAHRRVVSASESGHAAELENPPGGVPPALSGRPAGGAPLPVRRAEQPGPCFNRPVPYPGGGICPGTAAAAPAVVPVAREESSQFFHKPFKNRSPLCVPHSLC